MPCARSSRPSRPPSTSCRSNSPRPARIPRTPPSRPPPTSSSPPSRSRPPASQRRKPGGQPGHTSHQRDLFPPEMLASMPTDYLLDACPGCGGHLLLTDDAEPIVVQRVDIAAVPLEIHEHRSHPGWCPHCRKAYYAPLPLSIERGGLAGPRLTTVIAYLKGACHASFSTIRKFVRDVIGLTISRGQLAKIIGKVSRALERPYRGTAGRPARARRCSTSMRPGTSRTASGTGPGASGPGCTRCSRSTRRGAPTC